MKLFNFIMSKIRSWSIWRGIARALAVIVDILLVICFFKIVHDSDELVNRVCVMLVSLKDFVRDVFSWPSKMTLAQALTGAVLLLPFAVISIVYFWHVCFHRKSTKIQMQGEYKACSADVPINNKGDDCLGRENFVHHIASIINGAYATQKALYLGIYGEWGAGKTSIMNLVREELKDDQGIVFVDFKSWEHEAREDILYVLFAQIARAVADRLDLHLAFYLFRYAVLLVPRKLIGIAGPIEWIVDLLIRIFNALTSTEILIEKIERRLKSLNAKIVVVIDDIDRLEDEDIRTVLRVLRTSGDMDRFIYCLLADREHLVSGVARTAQAKDCVCVKKQYEEEVTGSAREYIQKIVQMEIDLPPIATSVLEKIFIEKINDVLEAHGQARLAEDCQSMMVFREYVKTYRAMIRLINELTIRIGYFRSLSAEVNTLPVNVDDLIALSIVHLYDVDFWHKIYDYRDKILKDSLDIISRGTIEGKWVRNIFELETSPHKDVRAFFLRSYLSVVESGNGGMSDYQINVDQREAEQQRRLMARSCFNTYFDGIIPNLGELNFVEGVRERLDDEEATFKYFLLQNQRGVLMRCLDYLEVMDAILDERKRHAYLRVLIRLADTHLNPEQPVGRDAFGLEASFSTATRIVRCVRFMLEKVYPNQSDARGSEFLQIVRTLDYVVVLAHMIQLDDRSRDLRRSSYFFDDNDYKEIISIFLSLVKELQRSGHLRCMPDEEELRRTWRVLLRGNRIENEKDELMEYRELLASDASTYPELLHVLLPYRYYGSRGIFDCVPIYIASVAKDFDINKMLTALEKAPESERTNEVEMTMKNIKWCINKHKDTGDWPSPDEQVIFMENSKAHE